MTKSAYQFYQQHVGKIYDTDNAYGAQCVDGWSQFHIWAGLPDPATPNGWADGFWIFRKELGFEKDYDFITDPRKLQNGDWVVWKRGSSHHMSHIAMYYEGKEFGENQGTFRGFTLKETNFTDMAGALRWKHWAKRLPLDEIAREVIKGNYGNGEERRKKLTAEGYDYDTVQGRVNQILAGEKLDSIAKRVIRGDFGNGAERVKRLTAAGYDYNKVQRRVNEILRKGKK